MISFVEPGELLENLGQFVSQTFQSLLLALYLLSHSLALPPHLLDAQTQIWQNLSLVIPLLDHSIHKLMNLQSLPLHHAALYDHAGIVVLVLNSQQVLQALV